MTLLLLLPPPPDIDVITPPVIAVLAVLVAAVPKKYDRIWDSLTAFINASSLSTQPPDLESLRTVMRSSEWVADALVVGFWS